MENFTNNCPICNRERIYKSKQGALRGLTKPCPSCSNSIKAGGKGNVSPINGEKECIDCKEIKDISCFYQYKNGRVHSTCKECSHTRNSKYHVEDYRFRKYGLDIERYKQMSEQQNNKCAICGNEEKLYIDHSHETGLVRGLLCHPCNVSLGLLKENKETINNILTYLKNYE